MEIIIATPSINLLGGAQKACLQAINALRKIDCKLVLVTIDKTDWVLVEEILGESAKPDEELYLFSKVPEMPRAAFKQAFVAFFYTLQLFRIVIKNKNSLVINMGGEMVNNLGNIVYVNAIPLRLAHLFPEVIEPKAVFRWKIYGRIYSMFLRCLGDPTGTIVANSKFIQGIIAKYLGKKALVINPPVASDITGSDIEWRNRKNRVVTISRFRPAKGLEIIPEVASCVKNCEFALIGIFDKEAKRCLEKISEGINARGVQGRVRIFKNKPHSFASAALSTAKIFLHTQKTEAFGMSIVESMAAGCVPIVPRAGGPWLDILDCREGQYGFSYKSPCEAAQKIKLLIENENLRSEISMRAAERAVAFDSSVFESEILDVVKKAIRKAN